MSKKIFINNLNTFVSKQLFAELRNDQKNEEGEVIQILIKFMELILIKIVPQNQKELLKCLRYDLLFYNRYHICIEI